MIRTVTVTRYVEPLREGGSVPAIVEADDDGLYVLKFRRAAQGPRALVAELVAGEIGRALGLPVPEIVLAELDASLGRAERDPEIQPVLMASGGRNLALDFLPGALAFDPMASHHIDPRLASSVVWFDAYVTNVDRTPRNANLLLWHQRLWLIDHGSALFFHHNWAHALERAHAPFTQVRQHILLPYADQLAEVDEVLAERITPAFLREILMQVPDTWLEPVTEYPTPESQRAAYVAFLSERLAAPRGFVGEAVHAHAARV
jgi:hypothetical protein